MEFDYKKIITTQRLRRSTSSHTNIAQSYGSDRGRVIFSAPLRRMQSKAQVFSLESNASVRSRLTHSLEVSHIGIYLAQTVLKKFDEKRMLHNLGLDDLDIQNAFVSIVEVACLLHDIGNPPFGHLGEDAIKNWFKSNFENANSKVGKNSDIHELYFTNLTRFDGNPQGLRIITKLQGEPGASGLNLTCSQIAASIKYPPNNPLYTKKKGCFSTEMEVVENIWSALGLEAGCRHPLTYLMEASDDIAYSLSDIEDSIEKGIISSSVVMKHFKESFGGSEQFRDCFKESSDFLVNEFVDFRVRMINKLVGLASTYYVENHTKILNGDIRAIFSEGECEEAHDAIEKIKHFSRENIYSSKHAQDIELAGYNIVCDLLSKFSILLELSEDDFSKLTRKGSVSAIADRMFRKLPEKFVKEYSYQVEREPEAEIYLRAQLLVDYISGMTDDFALKVHRLLNGIDIKVT